MTTSVNAVIRNSQHKELVKAVIGQLGYDPADLTEDQEQELLSTLSDIREHGVDGGFNGFIYYTDTVKFAESNRNKIVKLLEEMAEQLGQEVVEMVSGFGYFRSRGMDQDNKRDLYRFLSGTECEETTIPNLMAWFAAEEVARIFE